ncbi:MAG: RHS repeat domain-containing protein [Pyrinomonadaceae bacterium]
MNVSGGISSSKVKLTKVSSSVSTTEYTAFDILGRVTAHKQTTAGVSYTTGYTCNLAGALIEETYPSGRVVKNVLDMSGDLSIVQSGKCLDANPATNAACTNRAGLWNYASSFTYNAAGAVTSMQLGNGLWESTVFNTRLQPTRIALGTTQVATNLLKLDYEYGAVAAVNNGNVTKQTITVPTVVKDGTTHNGFTAVQTYNYDSLNRLKSATENIDGNPTPSWKQTFTFDRYGNRRFDEANTKTLPKNCGTPPNQTVCPADVPIVNPTISTSNNRLSSTGWQYDAAGNTTTDPQGRTFIYDGENKQVQVTNSSGVVGQYFYNGDGLRIKKVVPSTGETTVFVYDASAKLVAEYSTIVEPASTAKTSYLTNDHLGSPRINTDANGNITARHDYMPFGEETYTAQRTQSLGYTADTVRKQFTQYERDNESSLDFAQARYYGYNHGRFTSLDAPFIDQQRITPQSWNLYIRALNNPLKFTDPTGMWHTDKDGNVLGDYDGECVDDLGACWNEKSGTWDFGGDKTPVQSTSESETIDTGPMSLMDFGQNSTSPFSSLNPNPSAGLACTVPSGGNSSSSGRDCSILREIANCISRCLNTARPDLAARALGDAVGPEGTGEVLQGLTVTGTVAAALNQGANLLFGQYPRTPIGGATPSGQSSWQHRAASALRGTPTGSNRWVSNLGKTAGRVSAVLAGGLLALEAGFATGAFAACQAECGYRAGDNYGRCLYK